MSDSSSRENAIELVEEIWGSPSLDLAKWADRERHDLKLSFDHDRDAAHNGKQEALISAAEAAARLVLAHWEQTGARDRRTAIRTLSEAAERLDEDQFLIGD